MGGAMTLVSFKVATFWQPFSPRPLERRCLAFTAAGVHATGLHPTIHHEGEPMADQTELLAEVQRELTAIRVEAERLAGPVVTPR